MEQLATKSDLSESLTRDHVVQLLTAAVSALHDLKYTVVRTAALAAVKSIVGRSRVKDSVGPVVIAELKAQLVELAKGEKLALLEEDMKNVAATI